MAGERVTRRGLLSAGAVLGSAVVVGSNPASAETYSGGVPWEPGLANAPDVVTAGPLRFFTADAASFIDAVVSRPERSGFGMKLIAREVS